MKAGWRTEPLNAVCQLINRGVSPAYVESGGVAVLNQKCVRDHAVNFDLGRRHNSAEKKVSIDKFLRAGDVLVNSTGTGTLGRVAQLRNSPIEPTTVDSHVTVVRPKDGLFYPEFFGYALIAIEEQIQEGGEGCGGQTELARSKLANDFRVSFPDDISTQQRIVTLLDEAFDGIATAKTNTEKNQQNARAIFESHLQAVISQRDDERVAMRLDDACDLITCGVAAKPNYVEVGVPFLSAKNVKRGEIVWSGYNCVAKKTHDELTKNNKPLKGDILYTRVGSYGEAAVVEEDIEFSVFVSLTLIKPTKHLLDNYFLKYYLNSSGVKEFAKRSISSSGVGNLNVGTVREFPINLPSLAEQANIVASLHKVINESRRLESIYQQKITALDELKKSLLHCAFNGEL